MPNIGARLRQLREAKGLSQGDIETKTGLLRSYVSRVENGHTVPSLETLQRFAAALEISLYQLFYVGDGRSPASHSTLQTGLEELTKEGGGTGSEAGFLGQLKAFASRINESDREALLGLADRLAARK